MKARSVCKVLKWEESVSSELSQGMRISNAEAEYGMQGEMEGKTSVNYIMYYTFFDSADQHRSESSFVGIMEFTGRIGDREGSFAMEDSGTFSGGTVKGSLKIIKKSGKKNMEGIAGSGTYTADRNGFLMDLECSFE